MKTTQTEDKGKLYVVKALIAHQSVKWMTKEGRDAVRAAFLYGRGKITRDELKKAAAAAHVAAASVSAAAYYANSAAAAEYYADYAAATAASEADVSDAATAAALALDYSSAATPMQFYETPVRLWCPHAWKHASLLKSAEVCGNILI